MFNNDKKIIQELSKKYLDYANSQRNLTNIELWKQHNDLKSQEVMVLADQLPWSELNINGELNEYCENPFLKGIEGNLRREIYKWENFNTTQTLNPYIEFKKSFTNTGFGLKIEEDTISTDEKNNIVSHAYVDQLDTLEAIENLKIPVITADNEQTNRNHEILIDVLGANTPIRTFGCELEFRPWDIIAMFRSVTSILIDLMDEPELIHATMRKFTDINIATLKQYEKEKLLSPYSNKCHCSGTHSNEFPNENFDTENIKATDCWAFGMAQVFSSCSPAMLKEFELEYAKEYYTHVGLVNYGCCEPLHNSIEDILEIPNIRKISISPWSNPQIAAPKMANKVIMARKLNPAFIAGSVGINEDAIRAEIRDTLDSCRKSNTPCELIIKDVSTVQNESQRIKRWCDIAYEEINR